MVEGTVVRGGGASGIGGEGDAGVGVLVGERVRRWMVRGAAGVETVLVAGGGEPGGGEGGGEGDDRR